MRLSITILSLLAVALTVQAEVGVKPAEKAASIVDLRNPDFGSAKQGLDLGGIFDSKRFSMDHTVGMSFASGSFGGLNQYYLNTITYKAKKPLTIVAQIGVQNQMYSSSAVRSYGASSTRLVVPYLGMIYQPRENILIEFQFSNVPGYYYGSSNLGFPRGF